MMKESSFSICSIRLLSIVAAFFLSTGTAPMALSSGPNGQKKNSFFIITLAFCAPKAV